MDAEDRVLVGVIKRKKDLQTTLKDHWYRIPQTRMPDGLFAEYIGFFLSGKPFKELSGSIPYYAPITGLELVYRHELIPDEPEHPRANDVYYRIALGDIQDKRPPIMNTSKQVITFVFTTWDRFIQAKTINDLYSEADYFVDRIYHALKNRGINAKRGWETEDKIANFFPGISILCDNGSTLNVSAQEGGDNMYLDINQPVDRLLQAVLLEIEKRDGPSTISIPLEGL